MYKMIPNDKPIRICYAGLMHRADDQRFVHKQCAALVKAGYEVVYFAMAEAETTKNGVKIYPVTSLNSLWKRLLLPWKLLPRLLRENCQVYHLIDPELLPVGLILKLLFRRRVLFDAHEDYVQYARGSRFVKWPANHICAFLFKLGIKVASCIFDGFVFGDDIIEKEFPRLGVRKVCFHHFPLLSMFPASTVPFAQRGYDVV